nr:transposase [uncultured Thiohalocapsa sp.]
MDSDNADPHVWADSAYRSEQTEGALSGAGYERHLCEKGRRNQPLNDEQQAANRLRSKTRSLVEHVFGFQHNSMGGKLIRTIGKARAEVKIGCMNLTYNLMRDLQLSKPKLAARAHLKNGSSGAKRRSEKQNATIAGVSAPPPAHGFITHASKHADGTSYLAVRATWYGSNRKNTKNTGVMS